MIEDADRVSGDHRPENVIVAVGPNVRLFEEEPRLIDMARRSRPLDALASIQHTGRVLTIRWARRT